MPDLIDLEPYFTVEAIRGAYHALKLSKTDLYNPSRIRIPMGADGITWERFERTLDKNAVNISRRVLNGSYQFYPLRQVLIPKDPAQPDGEKRPLSIASIRDALVQLQLYRALYDSAERLFAQPRLDQVSFAYRKHKSAPHAAEKIWNSFNHGHYTYALDADIRKFFDTLNHDRLMALIDNWVGPDTVARRLLWRYIRTDIVPADTYPDPKTNRHWQDFFTHAPRQREHRWQGEPKGVPQGGVLSGMLANLYLYEFDCWVTGELSRQFNLRYYRYADDFIMLVRTEESAQALREPVRAKLEGLKLELHPEKTVVRNISTEGVDFVGFHFSDRGVKAKAKNIEKFQGRFLEALEKEKRFRQQSPYWPTRLRTLIRYCVNTKICGPEPVICEVCGLSQDRRRNWTSFFASVVTDVDQLRQLDRWMRRRVCKYFRDNYRVRLGINNLRRAGMKSLVNEYYRQRETPSELCSCSPGSQDAASPVD